LANKIHLKKNQKEGTFLFLAEYFPQKCYESTFFFQRRKDARSLFVPINKISLKYFLLKQTIQYRIFLSAIEQYDDIKRKADKVVSEYKEARNVRDEKKQNYDAVQESRTTLFIDAFEHVKRNISKMYSDMTKSESFPNGGSATLTLESTTEPYLRGKCFFLCTKLFFFLLPTGYWNYCCCFFGQNSKIFVAFS